MELALHGIKTIYADVSDTLDSGNVCVTLTLVRSLPTENDEVEYAKISLFGKEEDLNELNILMPENKEQL